MTFTTEPLTKLLPLTVSVKLAPPASAIAGASPLIDGTGLPTPRLIALETPPPGAGVRTSMGKEPAV